jgi:hypothetical protein
VENGKPAMIFLSQKGGFYEKEKRLQTTHHTRKSQALKTKHSQKKSNRNIFSNSRKKEERLAIEPHSQEP